MLFYKFFYIKIKKNPIANLLYIHKVISIIEIKIYLTG